MIVIESLATLHPGPCMVVIWFTDAHYIGGHFMSRHCNSCLVFSVKASL
jgi:hypothetical protein